MAIQVSSVWRWVRFALEAVLALFLLLAATVAVTSIWSELFSHPRDNLIALLGPILCYWFGIGIVIQLAKHATNRGERMPGQTR
jgi:hypothetical protein